MDKKPTFRFPPALAMKSFSGAARDSIEFELPALAAGADDWMLELGEVHESARVILNGEAAGVVFRCRPFNAAGWRFASGLLGPVRLVPMKEK